MDPQVKPEDDTVGSNDDEVIQNIKIIPETFLRFLGLLGTPSQGWCVAK